MKQSHLNYIIDIGMGISFLACFITGVVKFPGLLRSLGINRQALPLYGISVLHDWSGVAMGLLVLTHLVLHWRWIVCMTKRLICH